MSKIDVKKDSVSPIVVKKNDRLLISGPCELEFYEVKEGRGLDFEVHLVLSMARDQRFVKIKPSHLNHEGQTFEQKKETRTH